MKTDGVHAADESIIGRSLVLRGDQETASLGSTNVNHLRLCLVRENPIDFHDGQIMALKPDVLTRKSTNVDDVEEIRLPWLNWDGQVLRIIEQRGLRDRLGSSGIGFVDEGRNEGLHLIMIPVRDGKNKFLIILVREIWVADDEGCSKTIWVLSLVVGMIPVTSGLRDLTCQLSRGHGFGDTYGEVVGELGSSRDTTLRDLSWAVHFRGAVHEEAVEMESRGLVPQLIIDVDDDLIAFGRGHDG